MQAQVQVLVQVQVHCCCWMRRKLQNCNWMCQQLHLKLEDDEHLQHWLWKED
jgi:hypothetical protein